MPTAGTEAVDRRQQHLLVPTAPAAALDSHEPREPFGQTQALDQAGHRGQPGQAGQIFVADSELRFRGCVDRRAGCGSKRAKSFTPGVEIPHGASDLLNHLTATTVLV